MEDVQQSMTTEELIETIYRKKVQVQRNNWQMFGKTDEQLTLFIGYAEMCRVLEWAHTHQSYYCANPKEMELFGMKIVPVCDDTYLRVV